jgi:dihydroxyacetone kinase
MIYLQILTEPQELSKQGCILEAAIEAGAKEIINIKDNLNEWDSKVGDGDCGTTVRLRMGCQFNLS